MKNMKKMSIYEPAMCCPTGLCGVSANPELLRISTVLNTLKKNGIEIKRYNLTNSPQEFVNNKLVNSFINVKGISSLPVTVLDGEIIIAGRYPTNEEFAELFNIPPDLLGHQPRYKINRRPGGCGGSGGRCR